MAGVACGFLPYVAVANIATALIAGTTDLAFYLGWCALAAAGQVAKAFLSGASTTTSHRATFAVLSEVRRALAAKLDRMPLGHTLIMMAVHGSVVRDQSIMSPEFAFTASVNLA